MKRGGSALAPLFKKQKMIWVELSEDELDIRIDYGTDHTVGKPS
jgi:hypothetical protein